MGKKQKELIAKTFGCCRFVYNYYLDTRIKLYEESKETLTYNKCANDLTQLKKELEWLKEVDSHALGNGDTKKASQLYSTGLIIHFFLGLIVATLLYFVKEPFLAIFNLSDEVHSYAVQYYNWHIILATFMPIYYYIYRMVLEDGDFSISLATDSFQMVVNIISSIILVQIPGLGMNGLGIGTVISYVVAFAITLCHFFRKTNSLKFRFSFAFKELSSL